MSTELGSGSGLGLRVGLAVVGVTVGLYGAWLALTRLDVDQLVSAGTWLAGGVVLHDAVLAPLVVVAGALLVRVAPASVRTPVAVIAVVLGSVTLLAVPVLGGFGRRPDNPTLLDRDYGPGWLVLAGVVVLAVAVGSVVRRRRRSHGVGPGR